MYIVVGHIRTQSSLLSFQPEASEARCEFLAIC